MFSKKTVMIVGVIILIAINIIILAATSSRYPSFGPGRIALTIIAPFQHAVIRTIRSAQGLWSHYFDLVNVSEENLALREDLGWALEKSNQLKEVELSNLRLRNLLKFQKSVSSRFLAAEVIGKDPSPWFRSVIIDKGSRDGVKKGLPVVIPDGVAGQITEVAGGYSKVLLIIDQNSAVDALDQRTRARGIVAGGDENRCVFKYVLRKHEISVGDTVISSGLDGVFPKGLRVGQVSGVIRRSAGIFQEVTVTPFADFEKLEEVLVILNPPVHEFEEVK
jgi:rod shape-determining protein MreC